MFTFTETELKQLLSRTIELFTSQDSVFDFSDTAPADTVEAMMSQLQAQAEDEIFKAALLEDVEDSGRDDGDNIHEAALGLQPVA